MWQLPGNWSCNFRGAGRRKTRFAAVSIVFKASQAVYAVRGTFGGLAAAAPVLPFAMVALSPLNQPTTWHQFAWPASVTQNKPCLGGQTPQIEFRFSTKFDRESLFLLLCWMIFCDNSENACLVINFLTNHMQIKLNSKKKFRNSTWQVSR